MSLLGQLREIARAIRGARFPARPKRRYDLVSEAAARPFGRSAGKGQVREGGVTDDEEPEGE